MERQQKIESNSNYSHVVSSGKKTQRKVMLQ